MRPRSAVDPPAIGPSSSAFDRPWAFPLIACFLLLALLGARLINDPDLGFHLRGGQWMLQSHRFFSTDTYTYTVSDHKYLNIHWLYQIVLFGAYRVGGYPLLTILNVALLALIGFSTLLRLRLTGAPPWICVVLLLTAVVASETRFVVRPEVVSWCFMSLTLLILELRAAGRRNLLWLLPPIHWIWANTEGLFALGWALMAIHLVAGYILTRKTDFTLLRSFALSVVVCLLNPNLVDGALYPFSHLLMLGTSNVFKRFIGELQSPWGRDAFIATVPLWTYRVFSVVLLILILTSPRRRKIHEGLLAVSFFCLSATAVRNISIFMLAVVPVVASCWKDLEWEWLLKSQRSTLARPATAWAFTVLTLLFCLRVATNAYYISDRRGERFGLGLDGERQPITAAQFLADNQLSRRILNQMNWGGWLDWRGPQKTFVDGRLEVMGEEFYSEYLASYRGGLGRLADKYNADIIFFGHAIGNWQSELATTSEWRLVYLDGFFAIYLRDGYATWMPQLETVTLLREHGVPVPTSDAAAFLKQASRPPPLVAWLEGFYQPQIYPEGLLNMAAFNFNAGNSKAAECLLLEALRRAQGRYFEIYHNLGLMYFKNGRYAEATLCMQRVLEDEPDNKVALQVLARIPN